jgi:hypothetical protein
VHADEFSADRSAPLGSEREKRAWVRAGTNRRGPLVMNGGRARGAGSAGLVWVEMGFSIFLEFLMPFLFIFSRDFNSNSNQVSNSNQIKHVHKFKEDLGLNMMQQFMTYIALTNK